MWNNFKICRTPWSKFKGLMFSKKLKQPLVFINKKEMRIPIHMLFVFFPIDILWLNSKKEVVYIKRNVKPFTFVNPKVKAKYIIEIPNNSSKNVKLGDIFKI